MPAYAVMVEAVTNGIFWHSFSEPVGTVQSWLSLTAGAPVEVNQRLLASSELLHRDDAHGITTVHITNDGHDVVCAGVARCVLVGRTSAALTAIKAAVPTEADDLVPEAAAVVLAPPIDPGLDGNQILSAISDGRMSAGPICQLLSATVTSSQDRTRMTVSPQPWMANPLGAMQGGVIAAIVGQACSLAGQLHTGPGQQYSLADLTVYYFRSPPVDDGALTVVTAPDRIGRRLGTVSATMTGSDGVLFARATASIRYH
ncbi:MAG: hypothetical protein QOF25_3494 [Mycobacterium sp.]|nr:hypothetical protein [Mycobacterium sp.]